MNLKETTPTTLNALFGSFKNDWFALRAMNREEVEVDAEREKGNEACRILIVWRRGRTATA